MGYERLGYKYVCVDSGKHCLIYGCLEGENETELCVLDVSVGGEGLMRNRNLTHTESIISAFEEMKLSMQTLRMKHLIVLDICSIYSKQSLILREEQAALRQKLLTILVHSKAHFIAIPIDNSLS